MNPINLFRRLRELMPPPALLVVSVVEINADGTSTVQTAGGDQFRARGVFVPVGQSAFVRNGVIETAAPTLATITIDV